MDKPILLTIYDNIYEFLKYRNLQSLTKKYENLSDFYTNMNRNRYISIVTISENISEDKKKDILKKMEKKITIKNIEEKITYIILLHEDSEYDSKTAEFKKLINLIEYKVCNIIIISKNKLSTHVSKQINILSTNSIQIFNYSYNLFKIIIPRHILCSPHRILTLEEINNILYNNLETKKIFISKILIDDPMCVWIGGKKGDVILVDRISEITAESICLKYVI